MSKLFLLLSRLSSPNLTMLFAEERRAVGGRERWTRARVALLQKKALGTARATACALLCRWKRLLARKKTKKTKKKLSVAPRFCSPFLLPNQTADAHPLTTDRYCMIPRPLRAYLFFSTKHHKKRIKCFPSLLLYGYLVVWAGGTARLQRELHAHDGYSVVVVITIGVRPRRWEEAGDKEAGVSIERRGDDDSRRGRRRRRRRRRRERWEKCVVIAQEPPSDNILEPQHEHQ